MNADGKFLFCLWSTLGALAAVVLLVITITDHELRENNAKMGAAMIAQGRAPAEVACAVWAQCLVQQTYVVGTVPSPVR